MTIQSIDTSSPSAFRTSFLVLLAAQMSIITYPTFWEYVYPVNFLVEDACQSTFLGICVNYIPNACKSGPSNQLQTFDYIVVGAGPSGLSVATRLATSYSDRSVLVIEAGNAPPVDHVCPQWFPFGFKLKSSYHYVGERKYFDVASRTEQGSDRYGLGYTKGIPYDYGKALGGSTVMNAMLFNCGDPKDYNDWAEHAGDSSWGFGTGAATPDGMLSYIKRFTKIDDPNLSESCKSYYGKSGPLTITEGGSTLDVLPIMKAAVQEIGYPILEDINCGKRIGYANVHVTIKGKEKNHAARALLSPQRNRKNLFVMRDTQVTKVNLNGNLGGPVTVSGVTVKTRESSCPTFSIKAKRDVVLSAGALNTPKILFLSGVGRAQDLTPFGITQKLDLPVGLNFHDHAFGLHFFKTKATQKEIDDAKNTLINFAGYALDYLDNRAGRLSFLGNMMYQVFQDTTDSSLNPNGVPNNQWIPYYFDLQQIDFEEMLKNRFGIAPEYANQLIELNKDHRLMMIYNIQLDQKSRGMIRLAGSNPDLPPKLYTNYLTDPDNYDIGVHISGINKLQELFNTTVFRDLSTEMVKISIPECDPLPYPSDTYWSCYFKYFLQNVWHPAGTCTMGKASDPTSVVDSTLKVIGVSGTPRLRVADSSIMPQVARGNIQCPCYAIGEKAADLIKASG